MAAFVLTVLYVAVSLLSPDAFPDWMTSLHLNEILGVLLILLALQGFAEAKMSSIPDPYLILGIFLAACMSIAATGWIGHVWDIVSKFLPIFCSFYFVAMNCRGVKQLRILSTVLVAVAFYILLQGALADHAGELTSQWITVENGPAGAITRYKGLGVLSDPNDLAQLIVIVIPLLWLRWKKRNFFANFAFVLVPAGILLVGFYFTHSRGGAIALIAAALFGFKDRLGVVRSSILTGILFAGLMASNVAGGRSMGDDDGGRVAAWTLGLELFKAHPIFGIGAESFGGYNETGNTAHNSYVLVLAETGLVGYLCWMGAIVSAWSSINVMVGAKSKLARDGKESKVESLESIAEERYEIANNWRPLGYSPMTPAPVNMRMINGVGAPSYTALPAGKAPLSASFPKFGRMSKSIQPDESELASVAKTVRTALVGLLASSFFLSRSYSMVFFIVLGMVAALRLIDPSRNPEDQIERGALIKRIVFAVAGSVLFLYLFVRLHGPR